VIKIEQQVEADAADKHATEAIAPSVKRDADIEPQSDPESNSEEPASATP
jgi:hypothetical protein